jgi:hypothetical protein
MGSAIQCKNCGSVGDSDGAKLACTTCYDKLSKERDDLLLSVNETGALLDKSQERVIELEENDTNFRLLVESLEKLNQTYHEGREKAKADSNRLREELENLSCEAYDLSCHEIDGGAPENRWEDMRIAITSAEQLINDIDTEGKGGGS